MTLGVIRISLFLLQKRELLKWSSTRTEYYASLRVAAGRRQMVSKLNRAFRIVNSAAANAAADALR